MLLGLVELGELGAADAVLLRQDGVGLLGVLLQEPTGGTDGPGTINNISFRKGSGLESKKTGDQTFSKSIINP